MRGRLGLMSGRGGGADSGRGRGAWLALVALALALAMVFRKGKMISRQGRYYDLLLLAEKYH